MNAELFRMPAPDGAGNDNGAARSRELELWDAYVAALVNLQDQHPILTIAAMRATVAAYDAWHTEFQRSA